MESYDRFIEFVKRSKAVSPTVAFETASALQVNQYLDTAESYKMLTNPISFMSR